METAKQYFRLTVKTSGGKITRWVEQRSPNCFRVVNREGDWGLDGKERLIVAAPADIVKKLPAEFNNKYGELEVTK